MRIADAKTPVVVLRCGLGGLSVMRYLGMLGVPAYGVDADPRAPGFASRYCRGRLAGLPGTDPRFLERLLDFGARLGGRPVLVPTSDETALFTAVHGAALAERFVFPRNDPGLVAGLVSKRGMYGLARAHGVPTPRTLFPQSAADVEAALDDLAFPVMVKGIDGARLEARTGRKMALARDVRELRRLYAALEDPAAPNLMLQEYIPGGDDQVWIFNGYFDGEARCRAGWTGHKLRQFPVHVGCASLGICRANPEVFTLTTEFMRALGYRGVLDIGYRLDPRDGRYKVLDINPRVGQAFRIFVARNGLDAVRAMYLHLTGQAIPAAPPREGRRWVIEDMDVISFRRYRREGTLTTAQWLRSFRGVQEAAWFCWRDPRPFLGMAARLAGRGLQALRRRPSSPLVKPRRASVVPE